MSNLNYLRLQVSIIFLLVAAVGATAIVRHPGWFGEVSAAAAQRSDQIVAQRYSRD
jgi:hypothetical protein